MNFNNRYRLIVPFILFTFALIFLFKLILPTIVLLLGSTLLAYVSFPLYTRISRKISHKSLSVILSLFIIFLIILIPFSFLAFEITQQGYYFYKSLSDTIVKGALFGYGCTSAESKICSLLNQAELFSIERLSAFGFDKQLPKFLPLLEEKITTFILTIPLILAQMFLTLVIAYFILLEWEKILKKIVSVVPMRRKTIQQLIKQFGDITYTVIYAQLFVALIQGVVGAIGFYVFGVPFPIFLGVVLAFCALIPAIGTAILWVPISLFLMIAGYFSGDFWLLGKGVGLFFYGLIIISTIDNFLLARIVRAKANVDPIIVIIGVIGGATMFGVVGIFIGPILLPLLITYFETFKERFM